MSVSKQDISLYLYSQLGLSKKMCQEITDSFFSVIVDALENGEAVRLKNFGKFKIRHKKSRIGRNPKTMEEFTISERYVVCFTPSKNLKKNINT